jgi:hypothetical protein
VIELPALTAGNVAKVCIQQIACAYHCKSGVDHLIFALLGFVYGHLYATMFISKRNATRIPLAHTDEQPYRYRLISGLTGRKDG